MVLETGEEAMTIVKVRKGNAAYELELDYLNNETYKRALIVGLEAILRYTKGSPYRRYKIEVETAIETTPQLPMNVAKPENRS
jgi:hypothetical protein